MHTSTPVDPTAETVETTYRICPAPPFTPKPGVPAVTAPRWRLARFDAQTGAPLDNPRWEQVTPRTSGQGAPESA